jgi:hypothetical protein
MTQAVEFIELIDELFSGTNNALNTWYSEMSILIIQLGLNKGNRH